MTTAFAQTVGEQQARIHTRTALPLKKQRIAPR